MLRRRDGVLRRGLATALATGLLLPVSPGTVGVGLATPGARAAQAVADREEPLKRLVVMIRSTVAGSEHIGAGLVFGRGSDRLYVVTANHVVRPQPLQAAENVAVRLRWLPGEWVPAVLLDHGDLVLDVAVLAVPGASALAVPEMTWQALGQPEALAAGQKVFPIGYPGGEAWFVQRTPLLVSSTTGQFIRTEGHLVPGHSGGVLVTETWDIVGIVGQVGSLLGQASRIDRVLEKLAEWGYPIEATVRAPPPTEEPVSGSGCEISGLVFDEDAGAPLSAVNLGLRSRMDDGRGRTLVRTIATTGPDGRFGFTCPPDLGRAEFPLRIQLWHPNWVATHITAVQFAYGDQRRDVTIPIRMSRISLKQPPHDPRPPLQPGAVGQVVIIPTRGQARSYDFRSKRIGDGPTGGDFYFSGEYPSFWANNRGQRGILDLGAVDRPLDRIPPPASGYTQSGVNAIVGHAYVALASVEGAAIVFRVLDIGYADGRTQHYRIQYVYTRR